MELVRLRLKNFLSFKELNHDFIKEPVLIKGRNLTEIESKETNGAGKSTMFSGIAYAILANSLRKSTLDRDLIMWGEEEAHIWLDIYCPIRKETLNIYRVLRIKGSALLQLTINDIADSVKYATINDGNAYILNWIGITAEDLRAFYILNKESYRSFISSSNNDKLSFINRFIKAENLENADKIIKIKIKPLLELQQESMKKVAEVTGELNVYKEQLEEERQRDLEEERQQLKDRLSEEIEVVSSEYEKAERRIEESIKNIAQAKEDLEQINNKINDAEKQLSAYESISYKDKYEKVQRGRKTFDSELLGIRTEKSKAEARKNEHEQKVRQLSLILSGKVTCPKCNHVFIPKNENYDVKDAAKELEREEKKAKEENTVISNLLTRIQTFTEKLKAYDDDYLTIRTEEQGTVRAIQTAESELTKLKSRVNWINSDIEANTAKIEREKKLKIQYERDAEILLDKIEKAETAEMESREKELEGVVTLTEKKLAKEQKRFADIEKQISDKLQWGLRMQEFRMSLALEQLRIIQNFANLSLQKQKSELRLSIDGFKRNAKGEIKSEITVTVINEQGEYKPFWSFSGGERARIEMALIQAFQEMVNGTNKWGGLHFLMIDEVLEGTDPLGLALLLESLADVNHPIYVISHVMNVRAGIKTFTVVKENGYSYIEEAD